MALVGANPILHKRIDRDDELAAGPSYNGESPVRSGVQRVAETAKGFQEVHTVSRG